MTSVYIHFFLIFLHFSLSISSPIFIPLSKHPHTNQHITQLSHSSHLSPINLLLDLNSPLLWLNPLPNPNNVSILPRRSIPCSASGLDRRVLDQHCTFPVKNSVTGQTGIGQLVKSRLYGVDDFFYVSAPGLLTGLACSVKGVIGLGRNRVGVVEQLTHSFGLSKRFSLCLSSSIGLVLFGDNNNNNNHFDGFNSMVYTPILQDSDSYKINLKSIKVQNKKITINQNQRSSIQISTINPYTLIDTNIYKELITAFTTATDALQMTRVSSIGEFELCYNTKDMNKVPVIDLMLQSEMVKWSIHGHNSMVKINNDVMCLGILDGGDELVATIVLGSYQLEDNLVEFDLGRSMIGFTSSLVIKQSSCSVLSSSLSKGVALL